MMIFCGKNDDKNLMEFDHHICLTENDDKMGETDKPWHKTQSGTFSGYHMVFFQFSILRQNRLSQTVSLGTRAIACTFVKAKSQND